MKKSKIKVLHFPYSVNNPYQQMMFNGLRKQGVKSTAVKIRSAELLRESKKSIHDVLHLHWIESPVILGNLSFSVFSLCVFHLTLILWRIRGKKIVWTVHNLSNHENKRSWLGYLNAKIVSTHAHAIMVHGRAAIPHLRASYSVPEEKVFVVHHGNYNGVIKSHPNRNINPDAIKFLFFGFIRPYKGVPDLIRAFSNLEGNHRLHIAGLPKNKELKNFIERGAQENPLITASLKLLSNKELEEALCWCNVVVLPFKDIFTSGSVIMALTAGRPIIAPRIGLIPEYIDNSCAFLYNPKDPTGLLRALKKAAKSNSLEIMAANAAMKSEEYSWDDICSRIAEIYSTI